ncbi:flagellar hook protein FlgE [Halomonas sp. McH1-25]|uniref:flagellar hook protein FlgE n=1 Tax=unclassified Halomonas TaxID=2609666 RepID=UPI001EF5F192|nr:MULTISPECIES: flagellar hook protein FlgE [unclassified Halomonas]MCG7598663.1 flagellar hook protein FlgE [Halomonas sp. McH1-25]MCP1343646.1 flagellar hook protein FlgE [Halomonas sp. FL8]MCP1359397.1 flagellar hook protein FlgE [Halomonas sp. BBD45]MCP1365542.1 flagellar hook protein FlgE [Halomonas sp. BBD48]
MGFSQALSGVNAASKQLDVVGNNIANSQTSGFKSSSVQFADVFAGSKIGLGTRVSGVVQDFSNGSLETTGRNLDLAIAGTGFFRFEQEGQVGYSRNGQLTMTADGDLINAQGARLMGYGLSDGPFSPVVAGGQPVPLNIPADDMPAQATGTETGVKAVYNLDQAIDETDASLRNTVTLDDGSAAGADVDYHYSNSFTVYDSLGNQRNATLYFEKTANPNEWNSKLALDGVYDTANDFTLRFDNNGQLSEIDYGGATTTQPNLTYPTVNYSTAQLGGDPAPLSFELNLQGTTQFADDSSQKSLAQDGYSSGALVGITVNDNGTVMRNYSNEKSMAAGQIALVNFRNPEGLKPSGDNLWTATASSGAEVVGTAGTGLFGSVESGTLEASNVDLTSELVDLIIAQRNYQANTNSIRTQSEVMDAIAQLR